MKYWDAILREVKNKDNESTQFLYTNIGHSKMKQQKKVLRIHPRSNYRKNNIKYFIDDDVKDVYFTKREAQCMRLLLQGHTIVSTANYLKLSPRTVEYYLKNMKMKMACRTKSDLVKKVSQSQFLKNYQRQNKMK